MGAWLQKTGESIYGTRGGPWQPVDRRYGYTFKDKTIYVHLLKDYDGESFTMPPMGTWRVTTVYDIFTGKDLPHSGGEGRPITISALDRTSSPADTIIAVGFEHEITDIWK
jgi:alpha-L-fucosidase